MSTLFNDIKFAFRMLVKRRSYTAIAVMTLAIGIGATTIMFSIANTLLLRPPEITNPEQIFGCYCKHVSDDRYYSYSYSDYLEIRKHNKVFSDLTASTYGFDTVGLEQGDMTKRIWAAAVPSNYLTALGVNPILGREFLPEEERSDIAPVIVLSYRLWKKQGGEPGIIGRHLTLNSIPMQVVGVAPENFTGHSLLGPDVWLPLGCYNTLAGTRQNGSAEPSLILIGRLDTDLNVSEAETQLQALALRLKEKYPVRWRDRTLQLARLPRFGPSREPQPLQRAMLSGVSMFLVGMSIIILLIACLNLAHMKHVHGVYRSREIAIRMAMGGGSFRIVRQLLTESLLEAMAGGACGLLLAYWGIWAINGSVGLLPLPLELSIALEGELDGRVLAATLGSCMLATLLSGLRPAWRLARGNIACDLKDIVGFKRQTTRRAHRRLAAASQIALAVVLVMTAVLLSRSAVKALHATPGYTFDGKLLVELDPKLAGYDPAQSQQVCEGILDQLRKDPEIKYASLSSYVPFGHMVSYTSAKEYGIEREDFHNRSGQFSEREPEYNVVENHISEDYFQSMGMSLLQGRPFNRLDGLPDAPRVLIIDEPLARKLRPDGDALGCLIKKNGLPWEVVGIVPGLRHAIFDKKEIPHLYVPYGQDPRGIWSVYIHLQTTGVNPGNKGSLLQRIHKEIRRVDPRMPVLSLTSLSDFHRDGTYVWFAKTVAGLMSGFGALALFLSTLGVYGVRAYQVAARTPEIGIRMAMGATQTDILSTVLRDGAVLTLAGLCMGFALAFVTTRFVRSILCEIQSIDPMSACVTLVFMAVASLLACYIPARRAASINPNEALRYE